MTTKVFIPDATFVWLMADISVDYNSIGPDGEAVHFVEVEITDPIVYAGCNESPQVHLKRRVDLNHPALVNKRLPLQVSHDKHFSMAITNTLSTMIRII